jgi:hypothetical protein
MHCREVKTKRILHFAERFIYKIALEEEIAEAEKVRQDITALGEYSARNPTLREAISEIGQMNQPPPKVINTVKALLYLLQEIPEVCTS